VVTEAMFILFLIYIFILLFIMRGHLIKVMKKDIF
jgi:hypothetical protein